MKSLEETLVGRMSNGSTLGAACSAPGSPFLISHLLIFNFTDVRVTQTAALSPPQIPLRRVRAGPLFIQLHLHWTWQNRRGHRLCSASPHPPKSPKCIVYSLKLPENRLLSWRRGQPFIKMGNDLWSLTPDRITFLLVLSGGSLCARGSWKLFF